MCSGIVWMSLAALRNKAPAPTLCSSSSNNSSGASVNWLSGWHSSGWGSSFYNWMWTQSDLFWFFFSPFATQRIDFPAWRPRTGQDDATPADDWSAAAVAFSPFHLFHIHVPHAGPTFPATHRLSRPSWACRWRCATHVVVWTDGRMCCRRGHGAVDRRRDVMQEPPHLLPLLPRCRSVSEHPGTSEWTQAFPQSFVMTSDLCLKTDMTVSVFCIYPFLYFTWIEIDDEKKKKLHKLWHSNVMVAGWSTAAVGKLLNWWGHDGF